MRVYRRHAQKAGLCARGSRVWAAQNGIDYSEYLKHGVPVERLEAIGDYFALLLVRTAREEAAQQTGVSDGQE
jgi:hypothetical protein